MAYGYDRWSLDWFVMNEKQPRYHAILQSEDGFWDSPGVRSTKSERVNAHGIVLSDVWKGERAISLEGRAYAADDPSVKQLSAAMKSLCSDPYSTYELRCDSNIGPLVSYVRLDGQVMTDSGEDFGSSITWSLQLVASDPRLYSPQVQTAVIGLATNAGGGLDFKDTTAWNGTGTNPNTSGLDFETTGGLNFGTDNNTGWASVRNNGTAPAPITMRLYGPLTTPVITNRITGRQIRYNGTLAAGEFVEIKPSNPSVLLGGTANRRHLVEPANFRGFEVPAGNVYAGTTGELQIGLSHSGAATSGGYLEVSFQSCWW